MNCRFAEVMGVFFSGACCADNKEVLRRVGMSSSIRYALGSQHNQVTSGLGS
jgi:hypothetical protein